MSLPLLWFYPAGTTVTLGSAWTLMALFVYIVQRVTDFRYRLSPELAMVANRFGFFFRWPLASIRIGGVAIMWHFFSVVWAIYLGCRGLWVWLPVPILVYYVCGYLMTQCRPLVIATVACRMYAGKPKEREYENLVFDLANIYGQLHARDDPP